MFVRNSAKNHYLLSGLSKKNARLFNGVSSFLRGNEKFQIKKPKMHAKIGKFLKWLL